MAGPELPVVPLSAEIGTLFEQAAKEPASARPATIQPLRGSMRGTSRWGPYQSCKSRCGTPSLLVVAGALRAVAGPGLRSRSGSPGGHLPLRVGRPPFGRTFLLA